MSTRELLFQHVSTIRRKILLRLLILCETDDLILSLSRRKLTVLAMV